MINARKPNGNGNFFGGKTKLSFNSESIIKEEPKLEVQTIVE